MGLLGTFRFSRWNKRKIFIMFLYSKPKRNGLQPRPPRGEFRQSTTILFTTPWGDFKGDQEGYFDGWFTSRVNQFSSWPFLSHVRQPRLLPKHSRRGPMGRYKNTDYAKTSKQTERSVPPFRFAKRGNARTQDEVCFGETKPARKPCLFRFDVSTVTLTMKRRWRWAELRFEKYRKYRHVCA
jgi:hypothetical protein